MDPLGRSALSIAIINENPEMMEVLLENRIQVEITLLATLKSFALTRIIMCFWDGGFCSLGGIHEKRDEIYDFE